MILARILIADDDVAYLEAFCEGMEACGHEAIAATNAAQAVKCLEAGGIDIAFLDVVMDGGGAITISHRFRHIDPTLPQVVISGRPEIIDSPLLAKGLRHVRTRLRKTASLTEINATVRRFARPAQASEAITPQR